MNVPPGLVGTQSIAIYDSFDGKEKDWGKSILGQTNSKCEVSVLKMISLSLETNMCRNKWGGGMRLKEIN